jgi:amidohydrolase
MDRDLAAEVAALAGALVEWRRDFHRHPETAFEERRTSSVVRAFLEAAGIEVRAAEPGCAASSGAGARDGRSRFAPTWMRCP